MTSVQDLLARSTSRVVVDEVHRPYLVRRLGVLAASPACIHGWADRAEGAVRRRGMAT